MYVVFAGGVLILAQVYSSYLGEPNIPPAASVSQTDVASHAVASATAITVADVGAQAETPALEATAEVDASAPSLRDPSHPKEPVLDSASTQVPAAAPSTSPQPTLSPPAPSPAEAIN